MASSTVRHSTARRWLNSWRPTCNVYATSASATSAVALSRSASRRLVSSKRVGASRRHEQQLPRPRRPGSLKRRRFFDDDVGVGAADPERAHAGQTPAAGRFPRRQAGVDVERRRAEVDLRVGALVVQARRNQPMLQRQRRLDQPGDASRGIEMAQVRLERTDGARVRRERPECLAEGRHLDRVTERGPRPVRFHVRDRQPAPHRLPHAPAQSRRPGPRHSAPCSRP